MRNFTIIILAVFITVTACKKGEKTQNSLTTQNLAIKLPNTPEDVIRTWEMQIGQNQFALAKLISTGKALETVDFIDTANIMAPITPTTPRILSMDCKEKGDNATCDCVLEDNEGKIKCRYFLLRQNGQWYLRDADSEPIEEIPKHINQKPSLNTPVR